MRRCRLVLLDLGTGAGLLLLIVPANSSAVKGTRTPPSERAVLDDWRDHNELAICFLLFHHVIAIANTIRPPNVATIGTYMIILSVRTALDLIRISLPKEK